MFFFLVLNPLSWGVLAMNNQQKQLESSKYTDRNIFRSYQTDNHNAKLETIWWLLILHLSGWFNLRLQTGKTDSSDQGCPLLCWQKKTLAPNQWLASLPLTGFTDVGFTLFIEKITVITLNKRMPSHLYECLTSCCRQKFRLLFILCATPRMSKYESLSREWMSWSTPMYRPVLSDPSEQWTITGCSSPAEFSNKVCSSFTWRMNWWNCKSSGGSSPSLQAVSWICFTFRDSTSFDK